MRKLLVLPLAFLLFGSASPSFAQAPQGPELRVNVQTGGEQGLPEVAMNASGEFVVVWSRRDSEAGELSLYARRFAADGSPETDEILVHENVGDSVETAVAMMEDGSFVVVYAGRSETGSGRITSVLEGRRFAADGAPLGEPFAIGTRREAQDPVIAARPEGGFVVAWEARREEALEIFVRLFDGDGSPVRDEIPVAAGNNPAIDVGPEGEIVVVWREREPGAVGRRYFVALQRLSPDGDREGRRSRVSNNSTRPLSGIRVAKDRSGSFFVVWAGILWRQGTLGRRFSPDGAPLDQLRLLDGSELETEITMAPNGEFFLVWAELEDGLDIFRREFRPSGARRRKVAQVNTIRPGDQRAPAVADDGDGNFVVVWESEEPDGSGSGVFARLYRRR